MCIFVSMDKIIGKDFETGLANVKTIAKSKRWIRLTPAQRPRREAVMNKITPCLWFDNKAEEAAKFYVSIIKNSKIGSVTRYGEEGAKASGRPAGTVMTVTFHLNGQKFMALNGGPQFTFTPAISFVVNCETQEEIDKLWDRLSEGGQKEVCGWLKDKYGVSWQIVPIVLCEMMHDKNAEKTERVMKALIQMTKIDIKTLQRAYGKK